MWNPNRAKFQSSTASPTWEWEREQAIVFSAHNCGWFSMYKFLVNSWTLIASCYDPLRPRPRPRGSGSGRGRGKAARGYSLCMIHDLRQGQADSLYLPLCFSLSLFSCLSCNFSLAACLVQRLMCLCNATLAHYPLIHFLPSSFPFWLLQPYRSFAHRWLWSSVPGTQISKSNADQIAAIIMNTKQWLCMTKRYPRAVKSLKITSIVC